MLQSCQRSLGQALPGAGARQWVAAVHSMASVLSAAQATEAGQALAVLSRSSNAVCLTSCCAVYVSIDRQREDGAGWADAGGPTV